MLRSEFSSARTYLYGVKHVSLLIAGKNDSHSSTEADLHIWNSAVNQHRREDEDLQLIVMLPQAAQPQWECCSVNPGPGRAVPSPQAFCWQEDGPPGLWYLTAPTMLVWQKRKQRERPSNVWSNCSLGIRGVKTPFCPKSTKGLALLREQATGKLLRPTFSSFRYMYKPVIPPTYLSTYVHTSGVSYRCEGRIVPLSACGFLTEPLWGEAGSTVRSSERNRQRSDGTSRASTASAARCSHRSVPLVSFAIIPLNILQCCFVFLDTESCFGRKSSL